jgi:prephenate dehydrogenase
MIYKRLVIVGVGLIGGSFGLAARKHFLAFDIVGVARRESTLLDAVDTGCCDWATSDLVHACTGADLVFLAPPVGQMQSICAQIAPVLAPNALVTDGGSTKSFVPECEAILGDKVRFLGGHPMAGSEQTGPQAARDNLYENATWILTPTEKSAPETVTEVETLVQKMGAKTVCLSPQRHDELLATTSHLPHVTAAALVHSFLKSKDGAPDAATSINKLVANGWRDSTRIAAGSAEMWRDISLQNRDALLASLDSMSEQLQCFREALRNGDGHQIEQWFQEAADERRQF